MRTIAAAATILLAAPVAAQVSPDSRPTSNPPAPADDSGELRLEDVVVTGDRQGSFGADLVQVGTFRNARVIDVPLTVNVVPGELLRAQLAQGIYDALRNTAGVSRAQLTAPPTTMSRSAASWWRTAPAIA